uniref:Adenylylsulfate kinase n=1 Tax=Nonomuraea gerenzanensis TaxID=93944 RepID=A0A1M4DXB2_9ACTN|nr:hypothetical protein BN4615_P729 [Nonomuraea gerenzanensis]
MIPALWLCGPPGVGKTTVAWELYTRAVLAGIPAAYVDIDQLGICYPEPAADPGRHRMKARNLASVAAAFQAAGARRLIVSGVVDPVHGVPADQVPRAAVTVCRLRAGRDELRRRLLGRDGGAGQVEQALREADALDAADFADLCVDTGGLSVPEVVRLVEERTGAWPDPGPSDSPELDPPASPELDPSASPDAILSAPSETVAAEFRGDPVLWLCGATGVGKSTVGFSLYLRLLRAGLAAAYVDLDQLGFHGPAPGDHRVKARNLAALWSTYRAAGAQALVVTGPAQDSAAVEPYADALPGARLTLCRLHAGREELTRRIVRRGQGGAWAQPGDPLLGRPRAYLLQVADEAVAAAAALEQAALGDLRVPTDGRTAEQVTEAVLERVGWLGSPAGRPS